MNTINSKNIYLRRFLVEDITLEYINALNDRRIVGLTEVRHKLWGEQNVIEYVLKSNKEKESELIGIFLKENDKHIGNIRIFNFSDVHKRVELGIMIYDKTEWSKGYGTEALNAIEEFVFKSLKYHKICADYYSLNKASARMFEKVGYVYQGIFKEHFYLNGEYVDSIRVAKINTESE